MKVTLIVRKGDRACEKAKALLIEKGFEVETLEADDPIRAPWLHIELGSVDVPILLIGDEIYYGLDGVKVYIESVERFKRNLEY